MCVLPLPQFAPGMELDGYVLGSAADGSLNLALRPVGPSLMQQATAAILQAVRSAPGQVLPLGDRSDADAILAAFPGARDPLP